MIKIEAYKTSDGVIHESLRAAKEHAENRFGYAVDEIARSLTRTDGKYVKISEYLENNVEVMRHIAALSNDRNLTEEE